MDSSHHHSHFSAMASDYNLFKTISDPFLRHYLVLPQKSGQKVVLEPE